MDGPFVADLASISYFLWGLLLGLCVFSSVTTLIAAAHGLLLAGLAIHGRDAQRYAGLWAMGFLLVGSVEEFLYRA
jgi:hypothetical protein